MYSVNIPPQPTFEERPIITTLAEALKTPLAPKIDWALIADNEVFSQATIPEMEEIALHIKDRVSEDFTKYLVELKNRNNETINTFLSTLPYYDDYMREAQILMLARLFYNGYQVALSIIGNSIADEEVSKRLLEEGVLMQEVAIRFDIVSTTLFEVTNMLTHLNKVKIVSGINAVLAEKKGDKDEPTTH